MSNALVAARGLSKTYTNGAKQVRAVNGIDLEIGKGEALAIVGPSGAGKSTLMHLLGGLDMPTHGKVLFDNVDIYSLSDKNRAKVRNSRVGFVFQFYHLLPEFTALENVMLPGMIQGDASMLKERSAGLLKAVGLENRMAHRPGELSGGESQRVAIARALINEPAIILCDEPTGNLDSKTSQAIYELLIELKDKKGMTIVVVTHDEKLAAKMDRQIHMRDGKLV
jgi:lipoprotein-releasing system ATP-binding protein